MPTAPDQIKFNGTRYIRADLATYSSAGDTDITEDKLVEAFMELEPSQAALLSEKLQGINEASRGGSRIPAHVGSKLLQEANEAVQGFGVEVLNPPEHAEGLEYDDELAAYINTGDLYTATLLWDGDMFYLTTVGDWRSAWEREYEESRNQSEPLPEGQ